MIRIKYEAMMAIKPDEEIGTNTLQITTREENYEGSFRRHKTIQMMVMKI